VNMPSIMVFCADRPVFRILVGQNSAGAIPAVEAGTCIAHQLTNETWPKAD
jgi:hypothetical protein